MNSMFVLSLEDSSWLLTKEHNNYFKKKEQNKIKETNFWTSKWQSLYQSKLLFQILLSLTNVQESHITSLWNQLQWKETHLHKAPV
jgi:hypothetical protein